MPARDGNLADGIGHVVNRNGEETFGNVLKTAGFRQRGCDRLLRRTGSRNVKRRIS